MTAPTHVPPPKPSPGNTAWLVAVEQIDANSDHEIRHDAITLRCVLPWVGYTAADLRTHWAARAKAARWEHDWSDDTLTVRHHVGSTITRTFHDQDPTT